MKYFALFLFLFLQIPVYSQVLFALEVQEDGKTYIVKAKAETSYAGSFNITNSAQCSFVIPTGGFKVGNITNFHGAWINENNIIAPERSPENDYIIFNLNGHITDIKYEKGKEVALFSFENIGEPTGRLEFISKSDVKMFQSRNLNVGNHISVLGAGLRNAYKGHYKKGIPEPVSIASEVKTKETVKQASTDENLLDPNRTLSSDVLEFSTSLKKQLVNLEWLAGQTETTSQFTIEKSKNGVDFIPIKEIPYEDGYHFKEIDAAPDYGVNYYRIKQTFNDGEVRYSEIRKESYFLDDASINMFPNPVSDFLSLQIGHFVKLEGTVHIFNVSGKEMASKPLSVADKQLRFNTQDFPNGLYFLIILSETSNMIERQFIVENGK
jgi:hypothetical protein